MVVDLQALFGCIHPLLKYVVIKKSPTWPTYSHRSDVDILCLDAHDTACTMALYARLLDPDLDTRITPGHPKSRVDFHEDGELDLRLDIDDGPPWEGVSPEFVGYVIGRRRKDGVIYVPHPLDELAIRIFEYTKYVHTRTEKVKHLEYAREHWDPAVATVLEMYGGRPLRDYPQGVVALLSNS